METNSSKLRQQGQVSGREEQRHSSDTKGVEFESAESMLRFDAHQTEPPASLPERLAASIEEQKQAGNSWWRRIMGKGRE